MTTKTFPLGTVLSITTGYLLAPNGIGGVYEILNFMTGDSLYTHQLPRVSRECAPYLLKQFPQLADIDASAITPENFHAFMHDLRKRLPAELDVEKMPAGAHYEIDPMSELAEMVHPDKIVVFKTGGGDA